MAMEVLELGQKLIAERPHLTALAGRLTAQTEAVDKTVRSAMRAAWLSRQDIYCQDDLLRRLYGALTVELRTWRNAG